MTRASKHDPKRFIKVIAPDNTYFLVDVETLEPKSTGGYDPWWRDQSDGLPVIGVNEWNKRRYERWLNKTRFRAWET